MTFHKTSLTARRHHFFGDADGPFFVPGESPYQMLKDDGHLSLQNVADQCGLSLGGVKKICSVLRQYGLIERIGSKKDGYWIAK